MGRAQQQDKKMVLANNNGGVVRFKMAHSAIFLLAFANIDSTLAETLSNKCADGGDCYAMEPAVADVLLTQKLKISTAQRDISEVPEGGAIPGMPPGAPPFGDGEFQYGNDDAEFGPEVALTADRGNAWSTDRKDANQVADYAACKAACIAYAGCVGISYDRREIARICILSHSEPAQPGVAQSYSWSPRIQKTIEEGDLLIASEADSACSSDADCETDSCNQKDTVNFRCRNKRHCMHRKLDPMCTEKTLNDHKRYNGMQKNTFCMRKWKQGKCHR